ncbi:hypothetical protein AA313_de0207529 [Arthrobotrys entomopaga]|nr:hypothetical protein AA313_de0207529 [Arthrobotrys entomopaga]
MITFDMDPEVATRTAPGRIYRDHMANAHRMAFGIAVEPSVSTRCAADCCCLFSNPSQNRYPESPAFTTPTASLFAHVIPSAAAPLEYHVVINLSESGPASVFQVGRFVPVMGDVRSPVYA